MKNLSCRLFPCLLSLSVVCALHAQSTWTLNPLTSYGPNGDGSIRPGQSIGISPITGNDIQISAPFVSPNSYGVQPGDLQQSTNGFNMRGLASDPVTGNLVFVDTHTGSSGALLTNPPNAAIYILNPNTGQTIGALNANGITPLPSSGIGVISCAGVADDGAVYVANQINNSANGFKIYRWPTANTNDANFNVPPTVAFSNSITPIERLGQTMAVRGAGTNTQIILGTSASTGQGLTNVFLFTTEDGTNFTHHRIFFPGITTAHFNDGIAFGEGNTFWTKQVGKPLLFLSYDPVTFAGTVIASYTASSPNDPLLNISAIAVDNTNHLLAGMEEIGGIANGGNGKVWLYGISDPTNKAPAILASRVYVANFQKTTAPMGYMAFGNGRLYAHASNNGFLVNTVDSVAMSLPSYQWTDYDFSGFPVTRVSDLPATTRVAVGQSAHFEVFAVPDVTNYQWYTNNVPIPGATSYYLNVPNVQTNDSGTVYQVVASNAAGSTNSVASTLQVLSAADFFHPELLWSVTANALALSNPTNFITSGGGGATPNERCIAYNALSNQLLVVRGPTTLANLKIFVIDADKGTNGAMYLLKTTGIIAGQNLTLGGIGVADDGAVYAAGAGSDARFAVYRWANTDSNTLPVTIFGTNSSAAQSNPIFDLTGSQTFRFGDNLAVRGAGNNTEIIMDSQNSSKYVAILRPVPDGTMTNWTQTGYLLQNIQGSYGSQAYGTAIGRSLQFGPIMPSPFGGNLPTFWQKRYTTPAGLPGAPLAGMSYNPGGGLAALNVANVGLPLFTNGPVGISFTLNLAAAVNFGGTVANNLAVPDTLDLYDLTDPSQAVLLSRQNLPGANVGNHQGNNNAIAQVIFGANPSTGTNYIFAIDANNGIAAYALAGGVTPPPKILTQPKNLRILEATSGSLNVAVDQPVTIQWFKGTNSPVDTGVRGTAYNIANAQASVAGDYFVFATNVNGSVTSQVAHVSIGLTNDNYTLSQIWAAIPGNASFPYVTSDGGANTPNERSFAYNARSNQLIVVRCPVSSTAYTVYVVDAVTGANLYTLNTTGVIHEGPSEVTGSNPIDLVAAAAADDGAIYICSETPNASGGQFGDTTKMLHIYRWADSGPVTAPVLVYGGDPSAQPAGLNLRWGDVMAARGSGTNTELVLNSNDGAYGAVLKPKDSSMTQFTNYWFYDSAGAGSIGRSLQFGANNTVYEKRKGAALFYSSYDLTNQTSASSGAFDFSTTLGGVAVAASLNLVAGVDFVGSITAPLKPDAVALYDISDPSTPMLIKRYNFPVNQSANANFICQTIIAGNRVFSLDANNGLVAFNIVAPASPRPPLNIARSGATVLLSWSTNHSGFTLQASPSVAVPINWTNVSLGTIVGDQYVVTNGLDAASFFRLIK